MGLDLLDFLRGRYPLTKLARLARQLPRTSRYQAAVHADEDVAARVHAATTDSDDESDKQPVPLGDWSPEVERLTLIADLLTALRADYAAVNSKNNKRPKVDPLPRPRTALERVKHRSVHSQHQQIVAEVLPFKAKEG